MVDGAGAGGGGADARAPLLEVRELEVRRGGEALLERVSLTVERG
jgi:ABC-type molybdenum transport system ATPase subunit/photorepair protein PhrA